MRREMGEEGEGSDNRIEGREERRKGSGIKRIDREG